MIFVATFEEKEYTEFNNHKRRREGKRMRENHRSSQRQLLSYLARIYF